MPPKSKKSKLTPKRSHGYSVVLFILGTLLPPLAVAARFGIGTDFWLNLLLTICGYIPGHAHNFYIQNIRNNQTNRRTPKWAARYGLVNTDKIERNKKRSGWAHRYNDRLPESTLEGAPYAEGQAGPASSSQDSLGNRSRPPTQPNGELWNEHDESYYGQNNASSPSVSSGRWHYPANFDDTVAPEKKKTKKKKEKKDRWARTEDAYSVNEESSRKRKKKKSRSVTQDDDAHSGRSESQSEFPEDPEGGLYAPRSPLDVPNGNPPAEVARGPEEEFAHEF